MKYDLVLVYPPNETSPNPKLGGARVAIFEDENSSLVSEEFGLSLIPLHAVYLDEEVENKNLPSIPENAPKIDLSMETYENFFDHLPKEDSDNDVAKRFWEIEIKDNFPKNMLGKLAFKMHSQMIFNKKTAFYPYLKKKILEHVNDMVFKRKATVELWRPLENAKDALNLAFWLVAITVVTDGMTCVLIHDQEQGPLVIPKGLTKMSWSGFQGTHKVVRDPRKKLLEDKASKDNVFQGMGRGQSKDLEPTKGHDCGDGKEGCQCGPLDPSSTCICGRKS